MDDEYGLGELAPHFEVALNPLHQIAIIAAAVLGRAREIGVYDPALPPMGYLEAPDTEKYDFSSDSPNRRLQVEAVWAAVKHMPEPQHEVIFYDELCFQRSGLDLVFRSRSDERITITEVKGTSKKIQGSPLRYLKTTRTKGRQLSWDWVWRSLTSMAYDASTADGFFRILRGVLEGRADRSLVIVRFDAEPMDAEPDELRYIGERQLSEITQLNDFALLDNKREWLREIDSRATIGIESLYEYAKSRPILADTD